jgi:hypothetical protein
MQLGNYMQLKLDLLRQWYSVEINEEQKMKLKHFRSRKSGTYNEL